MSAIIEMLKHKKTYTLGIMIILIGVCEGVLDIDIPEVEVGDNWVEWVVGGLMAITMRAGIAKGSANVE